jgi:hypothetical protein
MRNTWNLLLYRWNLRNLLFGSVIFVFRLLASLWWFNAISTVCGAVMPKCRYKIYNRLKFPGIRLCCLYWFQILCIFLGNYIKRRAVIWKPRLCPWSYVKRPKNLIYVQRHDYCYFPKLSPHRNFKIRTKKEINFYMTIISLLHICLSPLHTISVNVSSRILW